MWKLHSATQEIPICGIVGSYSHHESIPRDVLAILKSILPW